MSKRQFKSQASSSRAVPENPFEGFGSISIKSTLSYRASEVPDLSSISDPNIVVAFKNLSKADGKTKTKALDLLEEYVSQHPNQDGGVEDSILQAWVKFYPRLSINNHRRVREQSHGLQVKLLQSARKRMERHLPDTVGSWLAGCYDRDGLVARTAQNGIASFLDTDSKDKAFWARCQDRIVDYALEAINETPQTLSDERSTSSGDADSLYSRVICSSISLVTNLILKLRKENISKCQEKYEEYLHNKKLWAFASSEDAFMRKSLFHLLVVCLEKQPESLENSLDIISRGIIAKGLSASQLTSSSQLLQALGELTAQFPHVWTSAYAAGRGGSSFSQLENFIQRGSQGGSGDYWSSLNKLFTLLPKNIIPSKTSKILRFLYGYRQAIQGRDQSRQDADQAWKSYFGVAGVFLESNSDPSFQASLFREAILPIFEKYLQGEPERIPVTIPALSKAYILWGSNKNIQPQDSVSLCFQKLASSYIARSLTASHVQLEDTEHYDPMQKQIIQEGHRWFMLLSEVLQQDVHEDLVRPFAQSVYGILNSAIKTVINQVGISYSAAAVIEISMRLTPAIVHKSSEILSSIKSLVKIHLPTVAFAFSPSARYLISLLYILRSPQDQTGFFEGTWEGTLNSVAEHSTHPKSLKTIGALIADPSVCAIAQKNLQLQSFLLEAYSKAILGETEAWSLFETAITYDCYSRNSAVAILEQSLGYLNPKDNKMHSAADKSERAFKALEFISKHRPTLLNQGKENQMMMTTILLEITEISEKAIASRALALMDVLKSSRNVDDGVNHNSTLDLVQWNLELEPSNSRVLLIETLVAQAKSFREQYPDKLATLSFFPNSQNWNEALSSTMTLPPSSTLGVMRPFAGVVFLASDAVMRDSTLSVDSKTFPVAVRMARYTTQFITDVDILLQLPADAAVNILSSLVITTEIVKDQLDLLASGEYPPWFIDADDDEMDNLRMLASNTAFSELIKHAYQWQKWPSLKTKIQNTSGIVNSLISHLLVMTGSESGTYYSTKALGHLINELVDAHGWDITSGETWLSSLNLFESSWRIFKSSAPPNALGTTAILTGLGTNVSGSKLVNTFCNRLVSDVAGVSATAEKTLGLLVQLNSILSVYEDGEIPVAKNRLVFAVKQILSWTANLASTDVFMSSEACRALQFLLPAIKDVYGTYWETALEFCISIWQSNQDGTLSDSHLPMTGMSLKLYSILRKLDDANDDLKEALAEHSETISRSLTNLLQLRRPQQHQPMEFVDALLLRQIRDLPYQELEDVSDLYPLLASENRTSQSAAYDILERSLTEVQQQLSIDVLLEKKTARLPDELLSLLLETPLIAEFLPEALDEFPSSIRGYLLSWHLIYRSYASASFKVRNDYSDLLKSENYTGPFLGLLFDLLNTCGGKYGDVNKNTSDSSTIRKYDMWTAIDSETPKRDMYCLVVNLYYMCLKYTPNLARNWYLDCKSKQTKLVAGKWTVKVFSPILVQEVKDEITKWSEEQDTEKPLIIKASKNSPEIHAGYEIDDMMMQIVVSLPEDYPLQGVEVRGVNRVAANEKTWRAWQVIAQGVMRINTIIDGLVLFRENVAAAMAGKTECAICYSIIGSDKRMPDKRCGTCKNLFHGNCLFKWFQTSNQNTCPLCRNAFTYGAETLRRN